jgi:hypothetical protein
MAVNNDPVFAKTPKHAAAAISAANTNLDGSGTVTTLLTAGADGAIVTSLKCWATATSTAKRCNLFISTDGGTSWKLHDSGLMAAYTVANTTVQTPVTFVDKSNPDAAIVLPANARIGCTIMVAEAVVFAAEYSDLS